MQKIIFKIVSNFNKINPINVEHNSFRENPIMTYTKQEKVFLKNVETRSTYELNIILIIFFVSRGTKTSNIWMTFN